MQLVLPPEIEAFVQRQVESGKYQTSVDFIIAAIQTVQQQEENEDIYQGRLPELQEAAQVGWEAYQRGESMDAETAMAQIRTKLHQRHNVTDA